MPNNIKVGYQAQYEEAEMGILGANPRVEDIPGLGDLLSGANSAIKSPVATLNKAFNEAAGMGKQTFYASALNVSARLQRDFRRIVNPHMSLLFKGIGFRTFTFNFQLMARNQAESDYINNIIYTFRYHMHPSYPEKADGGNR